MIFWPSIITFLIIGAAELGDKTQLLTFGLATKFPIWEVLSAVSLATSVLMALAVIFGGAINSIIPSFYIQLFAGLIFVGFGIWTLLEKEQAQGQEQEKNKTNPFWFIFATFFMAELGDKTQLATFALTAKYGAPLQVWLGATLGMVAVNILAIMAGKWTKNILPERMVKWVGAVIFIIFGALTLLSLLLG